MKASKLKKEFVSFTFLLPALLFFVLFVVVPFIQGFPISMMEWDGMSVEKVFVGLDNYKRIFQDPNVTNAAKNTVLFTIFTLVGANVLGLAFAVMLSKVNKFNNVLRTLIFMPFCLSLVLSSFVWRYIYTDVFYEIFNIPSPLGGPQWVILGLAIISIWRDAGYCMVIYIAAIQGISSDYYEAADIEGCPAIKKFTRITLPMIAPAITANITLLLAWGMKVFDYPMAATKGGPGRSSETLAMLVYNNLFGYFRAGYGQTIAIVFTFAIFIISTVAARVLRSREVEL